MTDTAATTLKTTPLHARHRASGARMVAYAGWDMPVEYSGITAEHMAVRTRAGVFDVSHMGQIEIAGKDAVTTVQHLSCNDVNRLKMGHAHYSGLLTAEGTYIDDILQGLRACLTYDGALCDVFNLGESQTTTLNELIAAIEQALGKKAVINQMPEQPGDVPLTYADISKARALLDYNPHTQIAEGIPKFVEWFHATRRK